MAVPTSQTCHLLLSLVQSLVFIALCVSIPPAIQPLNIRPIPLLNISVGSDGETNTYIHVKDLALMNPYLPDSEVTVSGFMLAVISFVLPVSTFLSVWLCFTRRLSSSAGEEDRLMNLEEGDGSKVGKRRHDGKTDFLLILTAYFYAMGTTLLITDWAKLYVGRLRPNFYAICDYNDETNQCDADESRQNEGRCSFPSGHSSLSMSGCMMLSLYLSFKLTKTKKGNKLLRDKCCGDDCADFSFPECVYYVFLLPIFLALFVACSRVHDNWHHPSDVIAGALIGGLSGCWAFYQFYFRNLNVTFQSPPFIFSIFNCS
ncbi:hypothetical protein TrCOL_g2707 [Triparma columacea]|uniref:Phosphatidic acid phosphatase type 2/haloperoxidase domain-containing protein n=1 Tax=Triparma columacea TaxID=722753 RepID=A0A9W7GIX5_9STRA|nr:hypothetical protein TrCOL_g2707 [Triparma columacea]